MLSDEEWSTCSDLLALSQQRTQAQDTQGRGYRFQASALLAVQEAAEVRAQSANHNVWVGIVIAS